VLVPSDQEEYTQRRYLRDAFRGWRAYWSRDLHSYFDGSLTKHPQVSKWEEIRPFVWFFCVALLFVGICAVIAYMPHHYQIINPQVPRKFPTFTTAP
jgi:hypothetical protein